MPHDLGVTGPRDSRADEYIGKRSLFMPVANDPRRKQLVGLSVAIRRSAAADRRACHGGRGPSAAIAGLRDVELFEPERWAARSRLASSKRASSRMGETVSVYHLGAERRATIANPVALDPAWKAAPCVRWNGPRRAAARSFSSTARG